MPIWFKDGDLETKLVRCAGENMQITDENKNDFFKPIKIEIIDIPKIYHYNDKLFDDVFNELASTE